MPPSERRVEAALTLASLSGRRVGVWGAGVEGQAAVAALRALDSPPSGIVVVDDGLTPERAAVWARGPAGDLPVLAGPAGGSALATCEVVVKSPGISRHLPRVAELRRGGVLVTGGTALWFAGHRGRGVVGVTGSKGKSTTTVLLAHLLGALGARVRLGGNLGDALIGLADPSGLDDWVVAEISSFQASEVRHSPAVGVLTALFPDHLDWHGSPESYYDDKINLFRHGIGTVALNAADPRVRALANDLEHAVWFAGASGVRPAPGGVALGSGVVIPTAGTALRGSHNLVNLCAALTAVAACGYDLDAHVDTLTAAVSSFTALEHRLQTVSRAGGLEWVDDGLATNPDATAAALSAFPGRPLTLLVGGHDRGVDYTVLGRAVAAREEPTTVCTMPANGPRIATALAAAGVGSEDCPDLPTAVARAAVLTPAGGVVLLSPAAPSFGVYRDYRHRGEAFLTAIGEVTAPR